MNSALLSVADDDGGGMFGYAGPHTRKRGETHSVRTAETIMLLPME